RIKSRLTTSRPKNRVRWIANAALEPRTRAIAVARSPAWSDTSKADRTLSSFQVALNHLSVSPGMGQLWMFEVLNAYKKIKSIGMNRNSMMRTAQTRRKMRVPTPSIVYLPFHPLQCLEGAQLVGDCQVNDHDRHRHHGQRGRERNVVGDANVGVDDVADEVGTRPADQDRRDEVAERQRERKDRSCDHARQGQREDHVAH